jgi:hypothetical protein
MHLRTILLLLVYIALLRAWLTVRYSLSSSRLTQNTPRIRKLLLITLLFCHFTVVEATPTEKQAVKIIQTAWLTYIAYRTTLIKYPHHTMVRTPTY